MSALLAIIYILIFIIFALVAYAVLQIKLFGMKVKDFWSFIEGKPNVRQIIKICKSI